MTFRNIGTILPLVFVSVALAQHPSQIRAHAKGSSATDDAKITLAVALADFGLEQQNELALIAAADMFNQLGSLVLKKETATEHDEDAEHQLDSEDAYQPKSLLAVARKIAAKRPDTTANSLNALIDEVEARNRFKGGAMAGIHTHWSCDYFGNCVWVTHCHFGCY